MMRCPLPLQKYIQKYGSKRDQYPLFHDKYPNCAPQGALQGAPQAPQFPTGWVLLLGPPRPPLLHSKLIVWRNGLEDPNGALFFGGGGARHNMAKGAW